MTICPIPSDRLCALWPERVRASLERAGFTVYDDLSPLIVRYQHPALGDGLVLLPMDDTFQDYTRRMVEVVDALVRVRSSYCEAVMRDLEGTADAAGIVAAANHVVACWEQLGRCEDEFMPEYPDACNEYRDALDSALSALRAAVAGQGSQHTRSDP